MKTIRELRLERGMSQLALALAIGTSPLTVSKWENKVYRPLPHRMKAVCDFFGVREDELDLAPLVLRGPRLGYYLGN